MRCRAELGLDALEPLHWNEDRFEPPRHVLEAAAAEVFNAALYPEHLFADFRDGLARWLDMPAACLTPAHGAQALISVDRAGLRRPRHAGRHPEPHLWPLRRGLPAAGGVVTRVPPGRARDRPRRGRRRGRRDAARGSSGSAIPTIRRARDRAAARGTPSSRGCRRDCIVVADETYIDFVDPEVRVDRRRDVLAGRPVIVIRSFSKILGLAGLRVGFAISDPEVARLLDLVQEPFNVNRAALAAGIAGVSDPAFIEPPARRGRRGARACSRPSSTRPAFACTRRSRTSCSSISARTTSPSATSSCAGASSCAAAASSACRA